MIKVVCPQAAHIIHALANTRKESRRLFMTPVIGFARDSVLLHAILLRERETETMRNITNVVQPKIRDYFSALSGLFPTSVADNSNAGAQANRKPTIHKDSIQTPRG